MADRGILTHGALRSQNHRLSHEIVNAARAAQTTTSATFAAVTNASATVKWPGGRALLIANLSHSVASAGDCDAEYKITDGSNDVSTTWTVTLTPVDERLTAGFCEIVSLAKGAYTLQLEWANANTTGTLTSTADDYMQVVLIPVF